MTASTLNRAELVTAIRETAESMWKEFAREMHLKPFGAVTVESRLALAFEALAERLEAGKEEGGK